MGGLNEVFVLQRRDTGLASLLVHSLKLRHGILRHLALNNLDDLLIIRQIRAVPLQTDHVQGCRGFQGAVNVIKLSGILSLVQVGRHASVTIGLSSQQIGIFFKC